MTNWKDRLLPRDPRYLQITVLVTLLLYLKVKLAFTMSWEMCALTIGTALTCQFACGKFVGLKKFDPRSPFISGLSLCLLLRTNFWWLVVVAAVITIVGKFAIRYRDRHVFNPTNLALVFLLLVSDRVWLSPGQWGSGALLALFLACAGMVVLMRAERSDVTIAYLSFVALLLLARAVYLGDPLSIPMRQMQSGALLLFAFFMISDPKTIPDTRKGRILFAFLVAAVGVSLQFNWVQPIRNGIFYALALSSPLVPLINHLLPGKAYVWQRPIKEKHDALPADPGLLTTAGQ
jgi:Na+-transporting NADH:ubiquinone oxidoreductase subunit NqrB